MPALDEVLAKKIAALDAKHQKRELCQSGRHGGTYVSRGGKEYTSFSCNDYLGLAEDARIKEAAKQAIDAYGLGAGASRLVTGNHPLYEKLEKALAQLKGSDAALVFGSGYMANLGIIPALVGEGDVIIADKLVHACIIDGAKLSGARLIRFAHNDVAHCKALLMEHRQQYANCLVVTDHVFSMDGDIAPVAALAALAQKYDAWLMTDDAHGFGVVRGGDEADIKMGTLSKAAGAYGGYVCGSRDLIGYLATSARSLIYTTALPPAVIAGALKAVEIIGQNKALVSLPVQKARLFTESLGLPPAQSAIVPLLFDDSASVLEAADLLKSQGFLVSAIRPPTASPRLRLAFSALHKDEDILRLAATIRAQAWRLACAA